MFVAAAALIVLMGIILHFSNRSPQPVANTPPAVSQKTESAPSKTFSNRNQPSTPAEDSPAQPDGYVTELLALRLPREKIEEYLALHHRDAASLLAAFHASGNVENPFGDINYLKEAATNFPNDPHVQSVVLARNAFPEERRKWLDAFKESSPGNSLADYLSAQDHFKNNQPDAAINELLTAASKSQFENYGMESFLNEEELYRASGKSPLETTRAAMSAMSVEVLPKLSTFRGLAEDMSELQKRYLSAGDTASAENLTQMGIGLANRLNSGDGGKLIINQLVGMSIENNALRQLDQNTAYDFLGGKTPAQRMEELKQQKVALKEWSQSYQSIHPTMTEAELINYGERVKIYGELEAWRWVQQQQKPAAPRQGN